MSANIGGDGRVRQVDGRADPDEVVTPADAGDTTKLSKLLIRMLREIASLRRRWNPRRIDFEDVAVRSGGARVRLAHSFGGRTRYSIQTWKSGVGEPSLEWDAATDGKTLVLRSYTCGTATIRIEEAG